MAVALLSDKLIFPALENAEPDGLLAIGGDLSVQRLLLAYQSGIFPWYEEPPILWWYTSPRFVLFPAHLHVAKSMKQVLRQNRFHITTDHAFEQVIRSCGTTPRKDQTGTWIKAELIDAYCELHRQGYAHSAEAWHEGKLVGGLYGVLLGRVFFGESMFSLIPNASKAAFITFIRECLPRGLQLVDCQIYTAHLASLGARFISGAEFQRVLRAETQHPPALSIFP